jgi:hypothetical protein
MNFFATILLTFNFYSSFYLHSLWLKFTHAFIILNLIFLPAIFFLSTVFFFATVSVFQIFLLFLFILNYIFTFLLNCFLALNWLSLNILLITNINSIIFVSRFACLLSFIFQVFLRLRSYWLYLRKF